MSNDVGHQNASRLAFSQALDEEILLFRLLFGNILAKILAVKPGKQTFYSIINEH